MDKNKYLSKQRRRRKFRVRNRLRGDAARPRLSVHRSHTNIAVQIIDDESGKTLVSASSREKDLRGDIGYGGKLLGGGDRRQGGRRTGDRSRHSTGSVRSWTVQVSRASRRSGRRGS